jgi:hypothetical protein
MLIQVFLVLSSYGTVTTNLVDFPNMNGGLAVANGGGAAGSGAWEIIKNDPNVAAIPGYNVDHFLYTAPAAATTAKDYTANTVYDVISVQLLGDPTQKVDFQFMSDDSYATGYLGLTDQNGGDLLPATPSTYFFPTTLNTPISGGTLYYMDLLQVPLPVKFTGFTATKNVDAALLNWSVESENANTDRYEVELSTNGVEFSKFITVAPLNNGRSSNSYTTTKSSLSAIRSNGVIYFRIKQIDKDGAFVYSVIKSVRLDGKAFAINAFPNPVKQFTKLTIDLIDNAPINITIVDAAGKQVESMQIQGIKGLNVKNINMGAFASGSYVIKVQAGAELKTIPVVKTN